MAHVTSLSRRPKHLSASDFLGRNLMLRDEKLERNSKRKDIEAQIASIHRSLDPLPPESEPARRLAVRDERIRYIKGLIAADFPGSLLPLDWDIAFANALT